MRKDPIDTALEELDEVADGAIASKLLGVGQQKDDEQAEGEPQGSDISPEQLEQLKSLLSK